MIDKKKNVYLLIIIFSIFFLDQISKNLVIKYFEFNNQEIELTNFLNIDLIWNNGIAFGLLGFEEAISYNVLTIFIFLVLVVILFLLFKSNNVDSYFYSMIFGGALGNLFDRVRFSSVPDFIDFHYKDFHWFIFNIADIFITLGVICLIYDEIFLNKKKNEI
ncbi:signal peptidase II [Candidatus Pelagibacter sp.]|uniref:signal peptidase II n=1 Tax=Candidatus Pelagibacter sp. TaxID=2024849 RepID=UPI003F85A920